MTKSIEQQKTRILGIETSCDETAAAIVENGRLMLSSVVATQIDLHARYGGVFPEVASRQHIRTIYAVVDQALQQAHMNLDDIDAVAVTQGPGLAGSLVVGLNFAKGICLAKGIPLVGINHLEGHIYSSWVYPQEVENPPHEPRFPLLAVLVSGGHTELDLMEGHHQYKKLGGTTDDAAGEAFDKVARLLKLPYPGGPSIQKAAETGDASAFSFTRAKTEGAWNFSFSGIKTAVLREIKKLEASGLHVPVENLAASFQTAVVDMLFSKALNAAREYRVKEIILAGGVSANKALRAAFTGQEEFKVHIPALNLCTDNAAMVAAAGYYRFRDGFKGAYDMDVLPTWPLSD